MPNSSRGAVEIVSGDGETNFWNGTSGRRARMARCGRTKMWGVASATETTHASEMTGTRVARRIEVSGTVQGVGFRPFVYRVATSLGVDGWVRNDAGRVVVEVAGPPEMLTMLAARLRDEAPPQARVSQVRVTEVAGPAPPPGGGFRVEVSTPPPQQSPGSAARRVPPDLATCEACLAELFDPGDRRYRYPFLNCTDCGPRATIVDTLPYDRERTTMRAFPMCADCAREYADPGNRRFHAEPIACPACGPHLAWWVPDGRHGSPAAASRTRGTPAPPEPPEPREHSPCQARGAEALAAAVALVRRGGIIAVKGLGGYQLVCDATNNDAVARLRARKHRPVKPFAVMVADIGMARQLARIDATEEPLLTSVARPVVLLAIATAPDMWVAGSVAPGVPRLGLFLPTAGLHHLLLADLARPLVVTSGNISDEPIAIDDAEAAERLGAVADGFLSHDRVIRSRYDDSVTHVVAGRASVIRRARGYAPEPLRLPVSAPAPVLAVGGQLKHTFTLAQGATAFVGPHLGDLEQQPTMEAFERNLAHLSAVVGISGRVVAHDLHPGYLSTQYATALAADQHVPVQHHHAHVASCAAEHGITERVIGVAFDGLGLGDDGTLWGGEVLLADLAGYRRVARFGRAPMPGGAAAVRRPARMALGYLFGAEALGCAGDDDSSSADGGATVGATAGVGFDEADLRLAAPFLRRLPAHEVAVVGRMVERRVNCPVTSSAGRLFDAAAALLGLCDDATYEGEAAVALEAAAGHPTGTRRDPVTALETTDGMRETVPALDAAAGTRYDRAIAPEPAAGTATQHERAELPWRVVRRGGVDGMLVYDPRPTLRALLEGIEANVDVGVLAARFHATIAAVTVAFCTDIARRHGLRTVCLSGGVMQNQLLAGTLLDALAGAGLDPLFNQAVPPNDGGLSYGQAAVAAARLGGRIPGTPREG